MPYKKLSPENETKLINLVYKLRLEDPEPSLLQIIKIANESLFKPNERCLYLTKVAAKDIIDGVRTKWAIYAQAPAGEAQSATVEVIEDKPVINDSLLERVNAIEQTTRSRIDSLQLKIDELKSLINEVKIAQRKSRLKVGIAGLKAGQFLQVENDVRHYVDVVEIDRDQAQISIPRNLDYVITAQFISHKATGMINKYYNKDSIIWIDGGITQIKQKIHHLANHKE